MDRNILAHYFDLNPSNITRHIQNNRRLDNCFIVLQELSLTDSEKMRFIRDTSLSDTLRERVIISYLEKGLVRDSVS